MKCQNCQTELPPQQRFCGNCGQSIYPPVKHSAPVVGAPAQQAGGNSTAAVVAICLLLMLCGGGGVITLVGGGLYFMWGTSRAQQQAEAAARMEAEIARTAQAEAAASRAQAEVHLQEIEAQSKAMEKLLNEAVEGLRSPDGLGPIDEGVPFNPGVPSGLDPLPSEGVPSNFEPPPTTPPLPKP